ncbi:LysM domain-containing protein [Metarhizium anisopliae]
MLAPSVAALAVAASSGVLDSIVQQGVNLRARESNPGFSFDPNTSPYCTFWYDNDGSIPCAEILSLFAVSIDDFIRWNPSVTPSCDKFLESRSFCVEVGGEPVITTTTSAPTTSTSTSTEPTTTTKPSNGKMEKSLHSSGRMHVYDPTGIQTPSPTQPDIIDSCNEFHWVNKGENCENVAAKNGIPLQDFLAWNPKAGNQCSGLWANAYSCVSIIGYTPPTPTEPSNGVETPMPIQPGMVTDCNKFYYVKSGDSCVSIASNKGISESDLIKWNPSAGSQCASLWANTYACIGTLPAFHIKTRYRTDCSGDVYNDVSVTGGMCINTACSVGSLEIAAEGYCPDGQVQISYWEQPNCVGKWFGYGYTKRGQCRGVWTDGWKFRSLFLRCAKEEDDCVSQGTCAYDPEPDKSLC